MGTPDHVQRLPCRVFDAFNNCMNEQQKAGFRRLEESDYLPGLREFAMTRCAPFFWSFQPDPGQPLKIRNGTITYVRTGQRDIGITASHVYDSKPPNPSYLQDLAVYPDTEAQFGGRVAYPRLQCIDHNPTLDLATFNVPEEFVAKAHRAIHTPATSAADSAVKDYVPEFSTPSWDSGPKNNEAS